MNAICCIEIKRKTAAGSQKEKKIEKARKKWSCTSKEYIQKAKINSRVFARFKRQGCYSSYYYLSRNSLCVWWRHLLALPFWMGPHNRPINLITTNFHPKKRKRERERDYKKKSSETAIKLLIFTAVFHELYRQFNGFLRRPENFRPEFPNWRWLR